MNPNHCPTCCDPAACAGTDHSESELFNQEKHNAVVRQCCMLIDEKRALHGRLSAAYANMRDIERACDGIAEYGSLDYIKSLCRQFLTLPEIP